MKDSCFKFEIKPELCIQCHACEVACRTWRGTEPGVSYRRVISIEEGKYPNVKVTYLTTACRHCENPSCMEACPVGAITKASDGTVLVDEAVCVGCGVCKETCPYAIPEIDASGIMRKCDLCHSVAEESQRFPCARMCPTGALSLKLSN